MKFDFETLAYNRLAPALPMPRREWSRRCAILFSLNKQESRALLYSIRERFPIDCNNFVIYSKDEAALK